MPSIPLTREAWLLFAVDHIAPIFKEAGYTVPRVRVACAIPVTSKRGSAVGQCWPTTRSADLVNEIYISPVHTDPVEVLDTLTHELVHAVDDCRNRHGAEPSRQPARAICPHCRFKVSMLRKHLEFGPPICPRDMVPMEKEGDCS